MQQERNNMIATEESIDDYHKCLTIIISACSVHLQLLEKLT